MLVSEDSQNGCRAAVAAGAFAVAVPGGHSHTHDFSGGEIHRHEPRLPAHRRCTRVAAGICRQLTARRAVLQVGRLSEPSQVLGLAFLCIMDQAT